MLVPWKDGSTWRRFWIRIYEKLTPIFPQGAIYRDLDTIPLVCVGIVAIGGTLPPLCG
jgi:hypothetical protein